MSAELSAESVLLNQEAVLGVVEKVIAHLYERGYVLIKAEDLARLREAATRNDGCQGDAK